MPGISRRLFSRLLLAAPALPVSAFAGAAQEPPAPPASAACLAASDPALAPDDRARAEKGIAALEQSLSVVRGFRLPPGAGPAFRFSPLPSRRRP